MAKPVRFKDLKIGQRFTINLWCRRNTQCEKIEVNKLRTQKLNEPGFVEIRVDPELNEDDCYPVAEN
jgi:hypothetical protein